MRYYSDPTAARALGPINREFSRHEKKAKALCRRYLSGQLSEEAWEEAHALFRGIYKHVLDHVFEKELAELEKKKAPTV